MRLSRATILRVTGVTSAIALPAFAFGADFYLHPWQDEQTPARQLRLDAQAGYYNTKSDFDSTGALLIPSKFVQYSRFQTDLKAACGILPKLTAYARLGWARTELDQERDTSTNFGFTDSSAGLSYRVLDLAAPGKDGLTVDVQAEGDFPLYNNHNLTGPALGDATTDVTGGAFASLPLGRPSGRYLVALSGGGGFTYRTGDYSRALPWSVDAHLTPAGGATGFMVRALAFGQISLKTDPRGLNQTTSDASGTSTLVTSPNTGGSFVAGAVNPFLVTVRGELGYQFDGGLALTGFFAQSLLGQNAPNGFFAGAALKFRLGSTAARTEREPRPKTDDGALNPIEYGKGNQGFVDYALEAKVTRVNDRLNIVKLDKGTQDGVEDGQTFDIFKVKKDGSVGEPIARGHVTTTQLSEAVLTIDEYFKEVWIDEGFVAKRPVQ